MSLGTLYIHVREGDRAYTRTVLPEHLVSYFGIDSVRVATGPDEYFPSQFSAPKVPAFRFSNGTLLTESVPIAFMLLDQVPNNGGLIGTGTAAEVAQMLMWMNRFNFDLLGWVFIPSKMVAAEIPFDQEQYDVHTKHYLTEMAVYEQHLTKNTYLVGESVTLADLYCATLLRRPIMRLFDKKVRAAHPALMRWFETMTAHPVLQGFFDGIRYLDTVQIPAH